MAQTSNYSEFDDFNIGNDADWTRYDPLVGWPGYSPPMFSFSNGGYRIQPGTALSPGVIGQTISVGGSARPEIVYSDFEIKFDLVGWDNTSAQTIGVWARVSHLAPFATDGYSLCYTTDAGLLRLAGVQSSASLRASLNPAQRYTFSFSGAGPVLRGIVSDGNQILFDRTITDTTYTNGFTTLIVQNGAGSYNHRPDATFDNFSQSVMRLGSVAPTPPNIIAVRLIGGDVQIDFSGASSDSSSAFTVESSIDVASGYAPETGATIGQLSTGSFRATLSVNGSIHFYRIKR